MVCLAPRALGNSVRPRRLSGAVARPLNSPLESGVASFWLSGRLGVDCPWRRYDQAIRRRR